MSNVSLSRFERLFAQYVRGRISFRTVAAYTQRTLILKAQSRVKIDHLRPDAVQEMLIAMWRALDTWSPRHGTRVASWVDLQVWNELMHFVDRHIVRLPRQDAIGSVVERDIMIDSDRWEIRDFGKQFFGVDRVVFDSLFDETSQPSLARALWRDKDVRFEHGWKSEADAKRAVAASLDQIKETFARVEN
jgi:DNA-directed RNA polymerase specialized sigma24 family protein